MSGEEKKDSKGYGSKGMFLILFHSEILKWDGGNKDDYGKWQFVLAAMKC